MNRDDADRTRREQPKVALLIDADNVRCVFGHKVEHYARKYGDDRGLPWIRGEAGQGVDAGRGASEPRVGRTHGPRGRQGCGGQAIDQGSPKPTKDAAASRRHQAGDNFCIVSNDGDFAPLARHIREAGKMVIGIGKERLASKRLREACNFFEILDRLPSTGPGITLKTAGSVRAEFPELVYLAMGDEARKWSKANVLGVRLREIWPEIDYRRYGKSKLGALLQSYPGHFETRRERDVQEFRLVAR